MKRIKMPWNFRIQNLLYMPDGSKLWFTASTTLMDKLKIWRGKKDRGMAHSSIGVDIPHHGQWMSLEGDNVIHDNGYTKTIYTDRLRFQSTEPSLRLKMVEIYDLPGTPAHPKDGGIHLQGVEYTEHVIFTIFSSADRKEIRVFKHDIKTHALLSQTGIHFGAFNKWYHKKWEGEGIRIHPETGAIMIFVNFVSWISTHQNYEHPIYL